MSTRGYHQDFRWLAEAIVLARSGRFSAPPRPLAGCILVKDDRVVGQGVHMQPGGADAIRAALNAAGNRTLGSSLYLTLTPSPQWCACPVETLLEAGIRRVVLAPDCAGWETGAQRMRQAGVELISGMLDQEARRLNQDWHFLLANGRPRVTVKLAMSLDGRTALKNGRSKWITDSHSRADVHRQRAKACAILSGADTVIADNAALNVRWPEAMAYPDAVIRQPLRVVIDSRQRLSPDLHLFTVPSPVLLAHVAASHHDGWPGHVQTLRCPASTEGKVDLRALMTELARRHINSVWVEGGANLAGALLQQGLVDRLVVYVAPKLMGADARGLLTLPCFTSMGELPLLQLQDMRRLGDDLKLTYLLDGALAAEQPVL